MNEEQLIARALELGRPVTVTTPDGRVVRIGGARKDAAPGAMTAAERMRAMRQRRNVTASVTVPGSNVTHVTRCDANVTPPSPPSSPLHPPPTPTPARVPAPAGEAGELFALEPKPKRGVVPTLTEWLVYAASLTPAFPPSEAERAWNHYEANGWRVGRNPVKNWQACCRTCHLTWKSESLPHKAHENRRKPAPGPAFSVLKQNGSADKFGPDFTGQIR